MILVVCAPSSASSSSSALRANDILPSGGRRPRRYPSSSSRTTTRRATTTTKTKTKSDDDDDDHDDDEGENNRIDEKRRFHWSEKLKRGRRRREKSTTTEGESEDNTRDELRMMPKDYFRCSEKRNNAQVNMQEVHRDRDTSILVTDAQLEREFRDENDGPMTERLLVLLPSLRSSANSSANNEGLVEDLLFRVGLERVSSRLLTMRKLFPTCDVAEMATKNPKVYLKFSCDGETNGDDEKDEREWQLEIEKLERMFPFAGQNGLPNVQRMVQAVPQILDSEFVERSVDSLIFSGLAKDAADAKTKLHQNPRLILHVESAHNRSRFESASHFDQTNVKRNKVVYDTKNGEKYYDDDVTRAAQKM